MNSDKLPEPQNQTGARDHIRTLEIFNPVVDTSNPEKIEPLAIELKVGD